MSPDRKTIAEYLIPAEKCLKLALTFQAKIRELGSESRIVRGDNGYINWDLIFPQSLLGARLKPGYNLNSQILTPKEKSLLKEKNFGIVSIVDYDGILVSPSHNWPRSGVIDLKTKLGFEELLEASDGVLLRTSRFSLSDEWLEKGVARQKLTWIFRRGDYRFPFIDPTMPLEFNRKNPNKLAIARKPLLRSDKKYFCSLDDLGTLGNIMIYCFISGQLDRNEAVKLLRRFPDLAPSIVFFDTAHYVL